MYASSPTIGWSGRSQVDNRSRGVECHRIEIAFLECACQLSKSDRSDTVNCSIGVTVTVFSSLLAGSCIGIASMVMTVLSVRLTRIRTTGRG